MASSAFLRRLPLYLLPAAAGAAAALALTGPDARPVTEAGIHRLPAGHAPIAGAPAEAAWFDTEWGWIVVGHADDAPEAAEDVRAAVAAFYRYFGRRPAPGAVVQTDFAALYPALRLAGAAWQTA